MICGQVVNIYQHTHPLTNPFSVWLRCDSSQLYYSPKNKPLLGLFDQKPIAPKVLLILKRISLKLITHKQHLGQLTGEINCFCLLNLSYIQCFRDERSQRIIQQNKSNTTHVWARILPRNLPLSSWKAVRAGNYLYGLIRQLESPALCLKETVYWDIYGIVSYGQ